MQMKIALINDTHFGARGDSQLFFDYFMKFFDEVFFPYLEEHDIKTVIHAGDLMDRRKFVNFSILNQVRTRFMNRLSDNDIQLHCILGNHDVYYRNTNMVNSIRELFSTDLHLYEKPEVVDFDGFYSKIDLSSDYTYVINFWATWCSPCVKELPYFESVNKEYSDKNVKVILVSLDFPSQIESKLKPYIKNNNIKSNVILLDDSKMNKWVPRVSEKWDGGIPATLIVNSSNYNFYPNPFEKEELVSEISKVID